MDWSIRHAGSPKAVTGLSLEQIVDGLRDGLWEFTDEVKGPQDRAWTAIEDHPQLAEVVEELDEPMPRGHDDETRVDMNALIDVCLVLLIFFIITTVHITVIQKIVPIPNPIDPAKGTIKMSSDKVRRYMVTLRVRGEANKAPVVQIEDKKVDVLLDNQTQIDVDKLRNLLRPLVQAQPEKTELLLDAQGVSWGTIIAIQDAAKGAGVRIVHHKHQG